MPVQALLPDILSGLSDEILGCMELRQNPLFHKIPPKKNPYYVHESLQAGRLAAAAYKGHGIRAMCREAGLRYEITELPVNFITSPSGHRSISPRHRRKSFCMPPRSKECRRYAKKSLANGPAAVKRISTFWSIFI